MPTSLKHRVLTKKIIGLFYNVFNELGHGFIESIYHKAMIIALEESGLKVETKVEIPVSFRGRVFGDFEADLIVANKVILELKATKKLVKANEVQLLNYLRATDVEIGILFNFGEIPEFKRLAFDNSRKLPNAKPMIKYVLDEPDV